MTTAIAGEHRQVGYGHDAEALKGHLRRLTWHTPPRCRIGRATFAVAFATRVLVAAFYVPGGSATGWLRTGCLAMIRLGVPLFVAVVIVR